MDRRELWRRLASNPRDVRLADVERLLVLAGWRLNAIRGSHRVYRSPAGQHLSIPAHGSTVKPAYVRIVLSETREPGDD